MIEHGWDWAAGQDQSSRPILVSRDGRRIAISRQPDGHWVWCYETQGRGGTIVDAVQQLLGEQSWGRLLALPRRTPSDPPPPSVPPTAHWDYQMTPDQGEQPPEIQHEVYPLGERGWKHLTEAENMATQTVEAFMHALQEDETGRVVAAHAPTEDGWGGEISPSDQGQPIGWSGQTASLWLALPAGGFAPTHLIVAESFLDALRAHAQVPEHLRAQVGLASTYGTALNDDSIAGLRTVLAEMRREHPEYADLMLVDARSDYHSSVNDERAKTLHELAAAARINCLLVEITPAEGPAIRNGRRGPRR